MTIEILYKKLTDAIADVVAHEDCHPTVYGDLVDLSLEWGNRWQDIKHPENIVDLIREEAPTYLKNANYSYRRNLETAE